jgi:hypothetical protein
MRSCLYFFVIYFLTCRARVYRPQTVAYTYQMIREDLVPSRLVCFQSPSVSQALSSPPSQHGVCILLFYVPSRHSVHLSQTIHSNSPGYLCNRPWTGQLIEPQQQLVVVLLRGQVYSGPSAW